MEEDLVRVLKDCKVEIWYSRKFKTIYIKPPVKVIYKIMIDEMLKYYNLEIENVVVGRPYERYL